MADELKILVVEDNPGDVLLISEALRFVGLKAKIEHYETADAAMRKIQSYTEHTEEAPDLIVLDYNLPGGTACEMLGAVRKNPALNRSKKAVLTCSVAPRDREQSIAAGADAFVLKPSDLDGFLTEVGGALRELVSA